VFKDAAGYARLSSVYGIFQTSVNVRNACYFKYTVASNTMALLDDGVLVYSTAVSPGSATTLQNSQCVIGGSAWSVTAVGDTLTLNVPVTFKPAFAGVKNTYLFAQDTTGQVTGWQVKGTWTVTTNFVISTDFVSPSSGSGASSTFMFSYKDSGGYDRIGWVYGLFQGQFAVANGCMWQYVASSHTLWLLNDDASIYLGPITPGS